MPRVLEEGASGRFGQVAGTGPVSAVPIARLLSGSGTPATVKRGKERRHVVIVVDAVDRGDRRIRPPDIVNYLAAMRLERPEVGIGRVEDGSHLVVGEVDMAGEVEGVEVKVCGLKDR